MTDDLLRNARRCMLAFAGERGPVVSPMAFWSDGASLWMTASGSSLVSQLLRARQPAVPPGADSSTAAPPDEIRCAVYIRPDEQRMDGPARAVPPAENASGLSIAGSARVYTIDKPVALALHAPVVAAALAALAAKNAAQLPAYAMDLPRTPSRWLPSNRAAIRLRMERLRRVASPQPGPGIAPALPGVVPADIRRALAGQRRAVLCTAGPEGVVMQPVAVGAGLALQMDGTGSPPPGTPAVLAMEAEVGHRPDRTCALALHGAITERQALAADRATWWRGFDVSSAPIPPEPIGGIVLPD